jgi:hypothetical protein
MTKEQEQEIEKAMNKIKQTSLRSFCRKMATMRSDIQGRLKLQRGLTPVSVLLQTFMGIHQSSREEYPNSRFC